MNIRAMTASFLFVGSALAQASSPGQTAPPQTMPLASSTTATTAPPSEGQNAPMDAVPQEHAIRDGMMLGASFGVGVGSASGYPNDVLYNGNPSYYGSTPMLPGYAMTFTLMGALTSYLNVGVFGGFANYGNSDWKSSGGGGGLRLEAYPLIGVCACIIPRTIASNVGVYGQFGLGAVSTEVLLPGRYETIGGVESILSAGAFYELWVGRAFSIAPDLRYEVIASRTSDRNALTAGIRLALYPWND